MNIGNRLIIIFFAFSLFILSGRGEQLTAESPLLSPDGAIVAFVIKSDSESKLALMSSNGGTHRALSSFSKKMLPVCWVPDGTGVIVVSDGKIWQVMTDGKKKELAPGKSPFISPDGKYLVYTYNDKLNIFEFDSGKVVPAGPDNVIGWFPGPWIDADSFSVVTSDGKLALISRKELGKFKIMIEDRTAYHCFQKAAFCPSKKFFALESEDSQEATDSKTSIWVFNSEGKQIEQRIDRTAYDPTWSTNGLLFFLRKGRVYMTADFKSAVNICAAENWTVNKDGSVLIVTRKDIDANEDDELHSYLGVASLFRVDVKGNEIIQGNKPLWDGADAKTFPTSNNMK